MTRTQALKFCNKLVQNTAIQRKHVPEVCRKTLSHEITESVFGFQHRKFSMLSHSSASSRCGATVAFCPLVTDQQLWPWSKQSQIGAWSDKRVKLSCKAVPVITPCYCSMGGTALTFESWKAQNHIQNASQHHFCCFLREIWILKSGCSQKSPIHGVTWFGPVVRQMVQ